MPGLRQVLAHRRDLRLVLTAGLVSTAGDWILVTGLGYSVYALTGSTVASAVAVMATFAPQVLLGPIAGVFADRWGRKRTMVTTNVLLALGLLPLMAVRHANQVWIVVAVLVWEGAVRQFFAPAEQALLPRLVDDSELITANALVGQSRDLSRLVGAAAGGVIAAAGGIGAVALADAGSFAVAAVLIRFVHATGQVEQHLSRHVRDVVQELADGLRFVARRNALRTLMVFVLLSSIGEGVMGTLFAPFVRHVLHGDSQAYGLIAAVQAIGGILGGLAVASLGQRIPPQRMLAFGAVTFGAVDLAIFLYPLGYTALWPVAVCMVLAGLPGALTIAGLYTLFQQHTTDDYRGRVFGALASLEGVCQLAATFAAGYLGQVLGIIPVIAVQGVCYVVAGFAVLFALPDSGARRSPEAEAVAACEITGAVQSAGGGSGLVETPY
ncbi:MFS transporter [Catenulispora rubra]|uniref:MFS transporter n=1 Tax=Catenulispora rubra TaxID=280293 RepID=UPI0018924440|nr:MFS transporter [Catenulispora rubra]